MFDPDGLSLWGFEGGFLDTVAFGLAILEDEGSSEIFMHNSNNNIIMAYQFEVCVGGGMKSGSINVHLYFILFYHINSYLERNQLLT